MSETKERILLAALRLFAEKGYEAVSVSDIAGELGITKGALYRHYKSKRDIFDSILMRMERMDAEQAQAHGLPDGTPTEGTESGRAATIDGFVGFSKAMFRYWTENDFAASFRKMLTLEQFRDAEMQRLYQQYLADGPMRYTAELFAGMGIPQPQREAALFYGPMFLLYAVYDGAEDKQAALALTDGVLESAREHLKGVKK